jgi:putative aminopeptidase FrvX
LGGVTAACFEKEPPIRVYRPGQPDPLTFGRVVGHKLGESPRDINLYLQLDNDKKVQAGDFGIWDITDFVLSDDYVYARAIDDLVGCAAMLLTFWRLVQEKANADLYGIFTRAEEVGLVGAEMFFQSKTLPKDTIVISIEASKTLPGAAHGEGPVIRAGDRAFTFDEPAEFVLKQAAIQLGCDVAARTPQTAKIQRQLMTGGRCEAGAAILNGYMATGLAFPLGNYHNVSEHLSLEPEYIHLQDFVTGVNLLQQAALLMHELPRLREEFRQKEAVKPPLAARLEKTV